LSVGKVTVGIQTIGTALMESQRKEKTMLKDALVRIAQLDENFKDPHYYLNYETDLDKVIKFYWFEKLGWCGCGTPDDAAKTIFKLLDAVKEQELEGRKAKLTEYFGVGSVYDNDLLLCLSYELDRAGFTDHGSSIGWAWLTEDGEYFRWALKEAIDKDELQIC